MHLSNKIYKIGISGSYGGLNLGDEAILECIISRLRRSLQTEITVFSRNPENTLSTHEVERAIPSRTLSRDEISPEIDRLDLLILGGGGILFDDEVKIYMREAAIAHEKNVPVMTYAIGAGPLHDPVNQQLVRDTLNRATVITVRERSAKKTLEEAGVVADIFITSDPALLLKPAPLSKDALLLEGIDSKKRIIGISVREPGVAAPDINQAQYHSILANVADYMVERFDADILFIPMERMFRDLQHSHAVISQMLQPGRASVLKGSYTPSQLLGLMSHIMFAVGMRLHFLMFAAIAGVPFVALPYASKVMGFLESLQIETPPLHLVNAGRVIAHIDYVWDNRIEILSHIERILPKLQKCSEETNTIAIELIKEKAKKDLHATAKTSQ